MDEGGGGELSRVDGLGGGGCGRDANELRAVERRVFLVQAVGDVGELLAQLVAEHHQGVVDEGGVGDALAGVATGRGVGERPLPGDGAGHGHVVSYRDDVAAPAIVGQDDVAALKLLADRVLHERGGGDRVGAI